MTKNNNEAIVLTPNDFTDDPISSTEDDREYYYWYHCIKLAKFIDVLNTALSFVDLTASIANTRIEFKQGDKVLHSMVHTYPKTKADLSNVMLGIDYHYEFEKSDGSKVNVSMHNTTNDDVVVLVKVDYGTYNKSIKLFGNKNVITSVEMIIDGQEDIQRKGMSITSINDYNSLNIDLKNYKKESEKGLLRRVHYIRDNGRYTLLSEALERSEFEKTKSVTAEVNDYSGHHRHIIGRCLKNFEHEEYESDRIEIEEYAKKIFSHPRTKEVFDYAEVAFNNEFPGIIDFIRENLYKVYFVRDLNSELDDKFLEFYEPIIQEECDLPKIVEKTK